MVIIVMGVIKVIRSRVGSPVSQILHISGGGYHVPWGLECLAHEQIHVVECVHPQPCGWFPGQPFGGSP